MASDIIQRITEYIKIKAEQVRLQVIGHVASLLSKVLSLALFVVFILFLMFFLSFSLGAGLNVVFESAFLGHLTVGGLYLIALIILLFLAKSGRLQDWIEGIILKMNDEIEEHDE